MYKYLDKFRKANITELFWMTMLNPFVYNFIAILMCCSFVEVAKNPKDELKKSVRNYSKRNILPNKSYCGMQHWDDYYHVGNETVISVDEFPWLLDFDNPKGYTPCSAILISDKYALTLERCISHEAIKVVLGQHDMDKNVSCIATLHGEDCTDPKLIINITEKIKYSDTSIFLIRFERKVAYTDYLRPICLPTEDSDNPNIGDTVFTAGWITDWPDEQKQENWRKVLKFKSESTIANYNNCGDIEILRSIVYIKHPFHVRFQKKVLPLKGVPGPIMFRTIENKLNWFLGGFVMISPSSNSSTSACAEGITPAVVNWILENMRD